MASILAGNPQEIIITNDPRGTFLEGIVYGTPKPGTCMQIRAAAGISAGKQLTFEVYTPGTDGDRRPVMVLLNEWLLGANVDDALVTGYPCRVYIPRAGEIVQVLFGNATGTGDDIAVGDLLIIDNSTGKVIKTTGSPESEPWQALEDIVDPTADQLLACLYTGY